MQQLLNGLTAIGCYFIPAVIIALTARKFIKIPDELFRKILHFVLLGAYIPFLFAFETWWISVGIVFILIVLLYPVLALAGRISAFSSFVTERKKGELKSSMVLALGVMMVSMSVGWGLLGDRFLVLASVYAWGVGDAFAALIGKRYGKHKIQWKYADHHKSKEGSLAMFVTSTIAVFVVLMIRGGVAPLGCLVVALIAAAACTVVELCTNNGFDTVSCPAIAMVIIMPLVTILGG